MVKEMYLAAIDYDRFTGVFKPKEGRRVSVSINDEVSVMDVDTRGLRSKKQVIAMLHCDLDCSLFRVYFRNKHLPKPAKYALSNLKVTCDSIEIELK